MELIVTAPELEQAQHVLVLLHGRWYSPGSMRRLAQQIDVEGVACVTPAAPDRTWYPRRFMDPRVENEPQLSTAIEQVHATLDQLVAEGVAPERIILGGFSQGACVACQALVQRPRPLGGLVVLCGGLIGGDDEELVHPPSGALAGLPVLLTGTEQDDWVPVERVKLSADILMAAGARVDLRIYPPGPHEVHDEEVLEVRRLLLTRTAGRR